MPLDPSIRSGPLRELLTLYESASHDAIELFERKAVTQLGRLVGFDGAVWGRGSPRTDGRGVQIDTATVLDRDERLLSDYAATGVSDPVARAFFDRPGGVQSIDVGGFYGNRGLARIGECLAAHDVSHLLIAGGRDAGPASGRDVFSWLTAYRSDADARFSPDEVARYADLLPHWVRAREICAELSCARASWPPATQRHAAASRAARGLSRREAEVLVFVSRGYTYVETAALMGISHSTVRSHVRNLYDKLGVQNKTEAVFEARTLGLLD